jgi:hypothetical protein
MPEKKLISMLWKSGHLHKGETCVHCKKGNLTALKPRGNGRWARRCIGFKRTPSETRLGY